MIGDSGHQFPPEVDTVEASPEPLLSIASRSCLVQQLLESPNGGYRYRELIQLFSDRSELDVLARAVDA